MAYSRVVLVKTCQRHRDRRAACTQTWVGALRRAEVPVYFLEGGYEHSLVALGVVHVAGNDAYQNTGAKLQLGLRTLLDRVDLERVFVVDDDTFVDPARWLEHFPDAAADVECRVYRPNNLRRRGRWWVHGGPGWYMTRAVAQSYIEHASHSLPDDVTMGQVVDQNRFIAVDRPDLYGGDRYSESIERVSANNNLITCHHVEPGEMHELYERRTNPCC